MRAASPLGVPACDSCVDLICNPASPTADPFCCNGGYLSYYSSEPEWDAKCVAEVGSICHVDCPRPPPNPIGTQHKTAGIPLQAGARPPAPPAVPPGGPPAPQKETRWARP